MRAENGACRPVHRRDIQGRDCVEVRKTVRERVFATMDEVGVFPPPGKETGVEFIVCGDNRMNLDRFGQDGI